MIFNLVMIIIYKKYKYVCSYKLINMILYFAQIKKLMMRILIYLFL